MSFRSAAAAVLNEDVFVGAEELQAPLGPSVSQALQELFEVDAVDAPVRSHHLQDEEHKETELLEVLSDAISSKRKHFNFN